MTKVSYYGFLEAFSLYFVIFNFIVIKTKMHMSKYFHNNIVILIWILKVHGTLIITMLLASHICITRIQKNL